jgi:hypothetical protein
MGNGIVIGVRFSNGKKDPKYRYSISLTPDRLDEAIRDMKRNLKDLKDWKKKTLEQPERFDFNRTKI